MPSTTSSSVARLFASSTVITPSLPTRCIALAIISPMSRPPLAEIVPTWAISSFVEIFFERFLRSATTASTARSMPRFRSIGLSPAATALAPSSSISLATVTPSLVMRGAPNDLSRTTLRPLGPKVTLTALARMSTPRSIRSRASELNLTSFAAIFTYSLSGLADSRLLDDPHDVGLFHDDQIFAVELHFGARPLAEQHPVAGLQIERMDLAILAAGTRPHRYHLAFHRLFLCRVGDDDAAGTLFLR